MRLLNTKSLDLDEYFGSDIPEYSILSHTWGREELKFEQWTGGRRQDFAALAGYTKIVDACAKAFADGHAYLWVDTVCIDKRSSAELSEAINSMYAWYRDSKLCYAYLADVAESFSTPVTRYFRHLDDILEATSPDLQRELRNSRWFTRGWTLQELLAPRSVYFYNASWTFLGTKHALARTIASITGIHDSVFDRPPPPFGSFSIAQRMSWASSRVTTRVEDAAYCLLGIFNINMPLLYGEGAKAFVRLQEEIIRLWDDQSVFAWDPLDDESDWKTATGPLAPSPREFKRARNVVYRRHIGDDVNGFGHYTMTNAGLHIRLLMMPVASGSLKLGQLNCEEDGRPVYIPLQKSGGSWYRVSAQSVSMSPSEVSRIGASSSNCETIYIGRSAFGNRWPGIYVRSPGPETMELGPPKASSDDLLAMAILGAEKPGASSPYLQSILTFEGQKEISPDSVVFRMSRRRHPEAPELSLLALYFTLSWFREGKGFVVLLMRQKRAAPACGWCPLVLTVIPVDGPDNLVKAVHSGIAAKARELDSPRPTQSAVEAVGDTMVKVSLMADIVRQGAMLVVVDVTLGNWLKWVD